MNEDKIKEMATALWHKIVGYEATEKGVLEAIQAAYFLGTQDALDWKKPSG